MAATTREELREQMGLTDDFLFVNVVRHPIEGALQIPHDRISELAPTMLPDKQAHVIVFEGG